MRFLRVLVPSILFAAFLCLLLPHAAFAANTSFFGPLVDQQTCNCPADWGCLGLLIQNGMNFIVSIGIVIFVLVVAYAGVLMMSSAVNPHSREMARTMLLNAVVGLLIALSAWLLVDFIMKELYDPSTAKFGPWNSIISLDGNKCIQATITQVPLGTAPSSPGLTGTTNPQGTNPSNPANPSTPSGTSAAPISGSKSNTDAVAYLRQYNIDVQSSGNCSTQSNATCTSLDGIQGVALQQIAQLKLSCSANVGSTCSVDVTGGTEVGHATHAGGNRLDVGSSGSLNSYIEAMPPATAAQLVRDDIVAGTQGVYQDSCGNTYFNESNHWHVTVVNFCPSMH